MITPSYALTATERVLPKLALDFTTAALDSRVTFTRTTGASNPATYVNSNGYIASASNNQPRFDYDPVTLACKGLLIEESRSNLLKESNTFATSPWLNTRASSVTTSVVDPSGTAAAIKLTEDSSVSSTHVLAQDTTNGSATYTFSVYLKAGERTRAAVLMSDLATASVGINVNLSSGTFTLTTGGSWTNVSGSVTDVGNGWWRCVTTATRGAGTATSPRVLLADSAGNTTYTGNGTSGLYVYGAQLEAGAFATSYIPTTSAALTRNADVATMTGTNFSDWYNQSEGALSCEFAFIGYQLTNRDRIVSISDSTGNEEIGIIQNTTNGYGRFEVVDGGVNQALLDCINTTMVAGTTYQICGTYKVNSFCGSGSLGSQATDSSGSIPTPDRMCIGGYAPGTATAIFNGHLKSINYWPQRITNNETLAFAKI